MAYFPNGTAGEYLDAQCLDCPMLEHVELPLNQCSPLDYLERTSE